MDQTRALLRLCFPSQPLAQALSRHEAYRARHMREARAVIRQRQRACLGRADDEAAERRHRVRRHRVRAGAVGADER